jgi:hypothetical protein
MPPRDYGKSRREHASLPQQLSLENRQQRLACIDVPALPLQLLLKKRGDWTSHPAAVVDRDAPQGKLLWVTERHGRLESARAKAMPKGFRSTPPCVRE